MTIVALLKKQIEDSRWNFEHTVADITPEQLHTDPGGKALPLGSTYAHLLFTEDVLLQGLFQGKPPLYAAQWKDKTGASAPMPSFLDPNWSEENTKWSKSVKIDLPQIQKYQKAVFKATDAYMDTLTTKELKREVQVGGLGKRTILQLITNFIVGHMENVTGEISVLKGLQGAKGYPF
jgi:hypothetical protein